MNIKIKFSLMIAIFGVIFSTLIIHTVGAQDTPISQQQAAKIQTNCTTSITTLNQLHASDALLRVNRGQLYESIDSKLMQPFNDRAQKNGLSVTNLLSVTTQYEHALASFRLDYQLYEEQLSSTLNIQCAKQPQAYLDAINESSAKRAIVHTDTVNLNKYLDQYRAAVVTLQQSQGEAKS